MGWDRHEIADGVATGLAQRAQADDDEQAVYGFDALDELGLHPILAESLEAVGLGVWRERRYPGDAHRRKRSEGKRCDLVLTPQGRPLRDPAAAQTLFDDPHAVDPDQAYWLEVKTVAQFQTDGPFARYAAELLSPVAEDVRKLWSDPVILHAGLLLVLFTAGREVAEHDLAAWHHRCLDKGYPLSAPVVRGLGLIDRIGNSWCAAALFGVRGAG